MTEVSAFSCCLVGGESLLIQCGEALLSGGHRICGVASGEPAVRDWAASRGVESFDLADLGDFVRSHSFDYLFSIANLTVLPDEVIDAPRRFAINFHDGPLPRYAGLNTPVWALMEGQTTHAVTWHVMTSRVDGGDLLKERTVEVAGNDTALTLNARCYEAGIDSFRELLGELESDGVVRRKQDVTGRRFYSRRKRPPGACVVCWDQDAETVVAFVNALDFGSYANPLGLPKVLLGRETLLASGAEVLPATSDAPPGVVAAVNGSAVEVATRTRNVALSQLRRLDGSELSPAELLERFDRQPRFDWLEPATAESVRSVHERLSDFESYWVERLARFDPMEVPYARPRAEEKGEETFTRLEMSISDEVLSRLAGRFSETPVEEALSVALGAFLSRIDGRERFDLGWSDSRVRRAGGDPRFFSSWVPRRFVVSREASFGESIAPQAERLDALRKHGTFARDLALRYPTIAAESTSTTEFRPPVAIERWERVELFDSPIGRDLTVVIPDGGGRCVWVYDAKRLADADAAVLQRQFTTFLNACVDDVATPISELPLLSQVEVEEITVAWNDTRARVRAGPLHPQPHRGSGRSHADRRRAYLPARGADLRSAEPQGESARASPPPGEGRAGCARRGKARAFRRHGDRGSRDSQGGWRLRPARPELPT